MSDAARELLREIVSRYSVRTSAPLADATHSANGENPACGDHVRLDLRVASGTITGVSYAARACAVCLASCAILAEGVAGQPIKAALQLASQVRALTEGRAHTDAPPLALFARIRLLPSRSQCALLPWATLERSLET
ncbi:MAG: iron-sulfur cluster assembly scaffold protein [Planctomycetota bacterium]